MSPRHAVVVALAAALVAGCEAHPAAPFAPLAELSQAVPPGQSASGHVERDFSALGVPLEKYSFAAVRMPDGAVGGRFEVRDVSADGSQVTAAGAVICLTILSDGRTARLGGVIDQSSAETLVGRDGAWTVRDNGEGEFAPPDTATDLRVGLGPGAAQFHCGQGLNLATFGASLRGNVQVQP